MRIEKKIKSQLLRLSCQGKCAKQMRHFFIQKLNAFLHTRLKYKCYPCPGNMIARVN